MRRIRPTPWRARLGGGRRRARTACGQAGSAMRERGAGPGWAEAPAGRTRAAHALSPCESAAFLPSCYKCKETLCGTITEFRYRSAQHLHL